MSTPQVLIRTYTQISYLQSSALSTPTMLPPRALVRTRKLREQESRWLSFSGYKERKITLEARALPQKEGPGLVHMTRVQDGQGAIQLLEGRHRKRYGRKRLTNSFYLKNCQGIVIFGS